MPLGSCTFYTDFKHDKSFGNLLGTGSRSVGLDVVYTRYFSLDIRDGTNLTYESRTTTEVDRFLPIPTSCYMRYSVDHVQQGMVLSVGRYNMVAHRIIVVRSQSWNHYTSFLFHLTRLCRVLLVDASFTAFEAGGLFVTTALLTNTTSVKNMWIKRAKLKLCCT